MKHNQQDPPGSRLLSRLLYRSRQFWNSLRAAPSPVARDALLDYLAPAQVDLFQRLQPGEQRHAWQVLERLKEAGETDPDLLAAALLHDVGKVKYPLSTRERVAIVLGQRFFPGAAARWGRGEARGFFRPFVVAALHPAWGAKLAQEAGVTQRTLELIRRHQDNPNDDDPLLRRLQASDDEN